MRLSFALCLGIGEVDSGPLPRWGKPVPAGGRAALPVPSRERALPQGCLAGGSVGACQAGISGALDVAVAAVASQLPRVAPTGTGQLGTMPIRLPAAGVAATSSQRGAS